MKINNSAINLSSERSFYSYTSVESESIEQRADAAAQLDLSGEGKSMLEQLKDFKENEKVQAQERQKQNNQNAFISLKDMLESQKANNEEQFELPQGEDYRIMLMRKLIESFRRMHGKKVPKLDKEGSGMENKNNALKVQMSSNSSFSLKAFSGRVSIGSTSGAIGTGSTANAVSQGGAVNTLGGNQWTRTTVVSTFELEVENTAFEGTGYVRTADGRDIAFNVTVEMSRAFCQTTESKLVEDYFVRVCDPLVINVDSVNPSVTDQKFMFDLDSDGKEENVSFAGKGSGFLALDKNGDGIINDGSELFGTKSGDGFADLSVYDEDGNGFIDDGDEVFKHLKVWMLDDEGNKKLISAKELGIGAMYLGSADTQFSLNDSEQNTNAYVRKTGIYLKEDGGVGTMNHIDLVL